MERMADAWVCFVDLGAGAWVRFVARFGGLVLGSLRRGRGRVLGSFGGGRHGRGRESEVGGPAVRDRLSSLSGTGWETFEMRLGRLLRAADGPA
jgi:hypothetical protein